MALAHSTGLRNFKLTTGFATAFDTNGRLNIYTGAPPAAGAIATGTLLGTLTLSADSFAAAASGAVAINAVTSDTSADATGTAGWFALYLSTETALASAAGATDKRLYGTVATTGADMTIDNASIVAGGTIALSAWSYNESV